MFFVRLCFEHEVPYFFRQFQPHSSSQVPHFFNFQFKAPDFGDINIKALSFLLLGFLVIISYGFCFHLIFYFV